MKYAAILLLTASLLFVAGCEKTSSEVEKEQAGKEAPPAKPEQEKADAQTKKAERLAAEPEMKPEDLAKMDEGSVLALGNCQLAKYERLYGEQALKEFTDRFVDEVAKAGPNEEITSIQEALMAEGVSCTWHEIQPYAR